VRTLPAGPVAWAVVGRRDAEAELGRLESDLKGALHLVYAHKEALGALLARTAAQVRQTKQELAAQPLPALALAMLGQA
jgi:hypothetical protein